MERAALEQRFEAAMGALVSAHGEAMRYRSSSPAAEPILLAAQDIADGVRRAARHGDAARPAEDDCRHLEALAERLEALVHEAIACETARELASAVQDGDHARAADAALALFTGLEPIEAPPPYLYHPLELRQRARGAGESLPAAPAMATRIAALVASALRPDAPAGEAPSALRPLVFAASLESSGAEIALRAASREIVVPILSHEPSGELWLFVRRLPCTLAVSAAAEAEDEWWAASPVRYRDYLDALRSELMLRGVSFSIED